MNTVGFRSRDELARAVSLLRERFEAAGRERGSLPLLTIQEATLLATLQTRVRVGRRRVLVRVSDESCQLALEALAGLPEAEPFSASDGRH